ncbi:MAG: hypothetical protein LBR64_07345 [Dysgonamonadaceae bacterium]|jgi:hypothetical protein|nr:hypothetical protein [Dysgonamonadaceae bacterium]
MPKEQFTVRKFDFGEVCPSADEILSFLKASQSGNEETLKAAVDAILPLLNENTGIEGAFIVKPIEETALNPGIKIEHYLKGASLLALFVCTAGNLFTRLTEQFNAENNLLEAYIVDVIGSLTVEKAMDEIQAELESEMLRLGLKITNRYSPGYCNWPLSGQKELFEAIGNIPVNISLSEYCLMSPIKSVSGIIGIGKDVKKSEYACAVCGDKTCIYRKILNRG